MIRRSMGELYESIREFLVAVDDESRVVGLRRLARVLGGSRRIEVPGRCRTPSGARAGPAMVDACWDAALELELDSVFALTHAAGFFERCGYHQIDKAELPHKIWNECVRCPLFPNCQEMALIRSRDRERQIAGLISKTETVAVR